MGGRRLSPVWSHYKKIVLSKRKGSKAMCLYCFKIMEGLVKRMDKHLKICRKHSTSDIQSIFKIREKRLASDTENTHGKEEDSESSRENSVDTENKSYGKRPCSDIESMIYMDQNSEASSDSSVGINKSPRKIKQYIKHEKIEKILALAEMFRKKNHTEKQIFLKKQAKGSDLKLIYGIICEFLEQRLPHYHLGESSLTWLKGCKTLVRKLGSKTTSWHAKRKILFRSDGVEIVKLMLRLFELRKDL